MLSISIQVAYCSTLRRCRRNIKRPGNTILISCHSPSERLSGTPDQSAASGLDRDILWLLRYKLSLRDLTEMFLLRGYAFTHKTARTWEARFEPLLAEQ